MDSFIMKTVLFVLNVFDPLGMVFFMNLMDVNIVNMTFNNFMRHVVEGVGNTSLGGSSKLWVETGILNVSDVKFVMIF